MRNNFKRDSMLIMQLNKPSQFEYSTDGKTWKELDTVKYKFIRKKGAIDPGTIGGGKKQIDNISTKLNPGTIQPQ